ncbi:MAG: Endo,4-beta-xylanase precursor [Gammaproteobacteria bacterium]|nr:Endo,4-beta-xylanase precursor [Gammaproteobacteria bacterium]
MPSVARWLRLFRKFSTGIFPRHHASLLTGWEGLIINHHYSLSLKSILRRRIGKINFMRCTALTLGALVAITVCDITLAANQGQQPLSGQVNELVSTAAVQLSATSPGCGKRPAYSGLFNLHTTDGRKVTRTFQVQLPPTYQVSRAYPLIFVFHGAGGNSSQSYGWGLQNVNESSEINESADNAIFVFPDGVNYQHYGIGWDDSKTGYDMPFFDNMLKAMETDFCVNSKRVFVAGFSWGGDFATALSCARGAVIRAVVANSTTDEYSNVSNYATYHDLPCPTTIHPAVRFGHAQGGDAAYPAPRFATTSQLFRHFNSCGTASTAVHSSTSVMSCKSFNSCSKEFIECTFNANIGHTLPPNWAADTWAFFSTFT